MIPEFFIYNGLLKRTSEPVFSINNRGFNYGDGFFESIIAFNQVIPFLNLHLTRINKAIDVFKFTDAKFFQSPSEVNNTILYLARKNKHYKTFKIKIVVFRETGGLFNPTNSKLNYIIQTFKLEKSKFELNSSGLKLGVYSDMKKCYSPVSQFKTLNSLVNIFAQQYSLDKGFDDALILNSNNHVVETSNSNVFLVVGNEVITSDVSSGCVAGISRHIIIIILKQLKINVNLQNIDVNTIEQADEVFLTNAVSGVKYVLAFNNRRFSNQLSRKLISELNKKFYM